MGRLIDVDKIQFDLIDEVGGEYNPYLGCSKSQIDDLPTVEAIPKADYENRLQDDLKAILVEIQLEIEEIKPLEPTDDEDWQCGCFHGLELMQDKCLKLIQQKINSLEEDLND